MFILKIDLLDGNKPIPVAVSDDVDCHRLSKFVSDSHKLFKGIDVITTTDEDYSLSILKIKDTLKVIEDLASKRQYYNASLKAESLMDEVNILICLLEDQEVIKNG